MNIAIIILIAITGMIMKAETSSIIPENRSIYFVLKSDYRFDNGHGIKIVQLKDIEEEEKGFRTIEYFGTHIELDSDYYQDYGFLTMKDASDILYLVKYDKPWETTRFSISDVGIRFPLRKDGKTYFGLNIGKYLALMDIDSFEVEEYEVKEGNMAYELIQEELDYLGFDVIDGELKIIPKNEVSYRYQPPAEIIGDADTAAVCLNNEKYVVIQLNTYDDKMLNKKTTLAVMDKRTNIWDSYDIRGKSNWTEIFPPYILYRIGTAKAMWEPPTYTGEYVIVNYETKNMGEFFLEPPADIYYTDSECIIAKSRERLLYIPITAGEVKVEQAVPIYEEGEDKGALMQIIDGIFIGPAEIPEEIMIAKAKDTNDLAEELYRDGEIDEAIFYYELALEYDPEYAQAYSNLGLAYYKMRRYDKSIENSREAIELTDNDIIKASSYYNIAMAYEAMGEWEKALENYRKALEHRDHDAYREGIERMEMKLKE
ncbi:MAG: tetratricopeptide repeat protein [Halanaerobiaceae bacterium]|jgi:tetratricopeptide (TPR) repeat protein|nr:tetratricopeptide repeat protein [Halanaerobiaceae bacterium]